MRGFSGSTKFEFEIERYEELATGNLLDYDQVDIAANEIKYRYQTIILQVRGSSFFEPARSYGEPFETFPEDGQTDIEYVIGPDGKDWLEKLTTKETRQILAEIEERCEANDDCDFEPDFDEPDFDEDNL